MTLQEATERLCRGAIPPASSPQPRAWPPVHTGYTLTLVTGPVDRTHWWKNLDRKEPANVWWLTGGGLNRVATDVEIELWQRVQGLQDVVSVARGTFFELRETVEVRMGNHWERGVVIGERIEHDLETVYDVHVGEGLGAQNWAILSTSGRIRKLSAEA